MRSPGGTSRWPPTTRWCSSRRWRGDRPMFRFEVSGEKLDISALGASLRNRASGAFTSFEGWVRDHNDGRKVDGLDYEMFEPLALREGESILREAAERFGVNGIYAVHRHGTLSIGDCAV